MKRAGYVLVSHGARGGVGVSFSISRARSMGCVAGKRGPCEGGRAVWGDTQRTYMD